MNFFFTIRFILCCTVLICLSIQDVCAQYTCSSAHSIPALPFVESNLSTSETGYQSSGFCGANTNYNELDYIFKYTPAVDESVDVLMNHNNFLSKAGIYVFTDCAFIPTECIGFNEAPSGSIELNFIANAGITYNIFIGTTTIDVFSISVSKEAVNGVAINKPEATQALDVNGSIRIGESTTTPYAGTIRWNETSGDFEGYNGSKWIDLSNKKSKFGNVQQTGLPICANGGVAEDAFGYSVSISGDYAIVGAIGRDPNGISNQGMAYIFKRVGTTWIEEDTLIASDGAVDDAFGISVSIFGDRAIVGACYHDTNMNLDQGKAYVFKRTGTTWAEEDTLVASDGAVDDLFGISVSISADRAIVSAYTHDIGGNTDEGKAYIFKRTGTSWAEESILTASDGAAYDRFGTSVSISGDYVVVGSFNHDTNMNLDQGKAYIYQRTETASWSEVAILIASDGAEVDRFGYSVSIFGDYTIVGAYYHDTFGNLRQGKAYIYKRSGSVWAEEAMLIASDGAVDDGFGFSVSISEDFAIVGAIYHDTNGTPNQGKAYVYKRSGTTWTEEAVLVAPGGGLNDRFGFSVSISGELIIIGAYSHDTNGNYDQGKVYFH